MERISALSKFRSWFNKNSGFDIVKTHGDHTLRTHLMHLLDAYEVDEVIDVGANEGGFGLTLRELGFRGRIHSFEPVSAAFEKLRECAANDAKWSVHQLALGSEVTTATINVSKFTQMSSFLPANAYGDNWQGMTVESQETVNIQTLAGCFELGLLVRGNRYFLKMDTQGFDIEVFKGAADVLSDIVCLQSEMSLIPLYEGMPDYTESMEALRRSGFKVSGFFPITRNDDLALNEVDCVMVDPRKRTPKADAS